VNIFSIRASQMKRKLATISISLALFGCVAFLLFANCRSRVEVHKSDNDAIAFHADILVAEDSPVNQEVARGMLETFGCRVDLAANVLATTVRELAADLEMRAREHDLRVAKALVDRLRDQMELCGAAMKIAAG
jgi:hypothetical protein